MELPELPPLPEKMAEEMFRKMFTDPRTVSFNSLNWFTAGATMAEQWAKEVLRAYALEAVRAERERCAKLCETLNHGAFGNSSYLNGIQDGSGGCAAATRAQGSKT